MEKSDLIKIFVVVIAVSFLTEIFYFGGRIPFIGGSAPSVAKNTTGNTSFNGTIRTYDPLLILDANTSKTAIEALRAKEGVVGVSLEQGSYVVQTETRDDVYPLGVYLRSMNVTSYAIANVVLPQDIIVSTATGDINATTSGIVAVMTEPLLDVDSPIAIAMTAVVDSNNNVVSYVSPRVMKQPVESVFNATILRLDHKTHSYSIPWEDRTSLGNLSEYGSVEYKQIDSIVFSQPLTTSQILAKKQFAYVRYVGQDSALVEPGFSNVTDVAINFADVNYTLPASTLMITSNESSIEPDVPFNASVVYTYVVLLNSTYDFGSSPLLVQTDRAYQENESVNVSINATALGDKIVAIRSVSIPS